MKIDLEFLKKKKEVFLSEAEKLFDIQKKAGEVDHSYLVRSIVNTDSLLKGNLPFTFVEKCIKNTDDIYDLLMHDVEHHKRCDINLSTDVIKFWQTLNKKYKKNKPAPGDVVVGHYNHQNKIVTNGFLGIVKSVDANLNIEIIEASVINVYDEDSSARQFNGIKLKIRPLADKGKCRILGIFTPWFF